MQVSSQFCLIFGCNLRKGQLLADSLRSHVRITEPPPSNDRDPPSRQDRDSLCSIRDNRRGLLAQTALCVTDDLDADEILTLLDDKYAEAILQHTR